jgi:hypothetical protein
MHKKRGWPGSGAWFYVGANPCESTRDEINEVNYYFKLINRVCYNLYLPDNSHKG